MPDPSKLLSLFSFTVTCDEWVLWERLGEQLRYLHKNWDVSGHWPKHKHDKSYPYKCHTSFCRFHFTALSVSLLPWHIRARVLHKIIISGAQKIILRTALAGQIIWSLIVVLMLCVRLVMKTDDDAFVNMFSLLPLLADVTSKTLPSSPSLWASSSRMLLMCNVWLKPPVARKGKWRIDKTEWRYEYWPTFCQGVAFIMTMNFVTAGNRLVHRVPRLWLDDVSPLVHEDCVVANSSNSKTPTTKAVQTIALNVTYVTHSPRFVKTSDYCFFRRQRFTSEWMSRVLRPARHTF